MFFLDKVLRFGNISWWSLHDCRGSDLLLAHLLLENSPVFTQCLFDAMAVTVDDAFLKKRVRIFFCFWWFQLGHCWCLWGCKMLIQLYSGQYNNVHLISTTFSSAMYGVLSMRSTKDTISSSCSKQVSSSGVAGRRRWTGVSCHYVVLT